MHILLKKLSLNNFKGIREFEIDFDGKDAQIFGANESGKSTINTAFCWLLTGKDEFDRKDFEIKNTRQKELNAQSHEVEAILDIDGTEVKLKRVYLEKWEKPKGQSKKVFKGHTTEFYFNDVPCNASEYQAKVDGLIAPNLIKLLTNPHYFNTLKWEDQRRGLLGIAGEITNQDVINLISTEENNYSTLLLALNSGKTLEEYKRELVTKKGLLKKAAIEYQPRIDELKRGMPESENWTILQKQIQDLEKQIEAIDQQLFDQNKALEAANKKQLDNQKLIHQKQTDLQNIRFRIKSDLQQKQNEGKGKIQDLQSQIRTAKDNITRCERQIFDLSKNRETYNTLISAKNLTLVSLRQEWDRVNALKFDFDPSKCECPTCKQMLPHDEIESKKETLLKNFNADKERRKSDAVKQGDQVKAEIRQLEERLSALGSEDDLKASVELEQNTVTNLEFELKELSAQEAKKGIENIDVAVDALLKVNADALNLQEEITALESQAQSPASNLASESLKEQRKQLQISIQDIKSLLSKKETIEKTEARIQQLQKEETANAQEIANIERSEFEIEEFTRAKMEVLESRVNKMFSYVKWCLFEVQVNGCIAETCVCEYKGVPYTTLNTAARLLAGLDILSTFSAHYGVYAPVFCDNRESTTWIPNIKSQLISLYVSPQDKKLRFETEINKVAAVA